MSPLLSTISNGTVQIWEAVILMAAAASVHAPPPRKKPRAAQLDGRTSRISASNPARSPGCNGVVRRAWREVATDYNTGRRLVPS